MIKQLGTRSPDFNACLITNLLASLARKKVLRSNPLIFMDLDTAFGTW